MQKVTDKRKLAEVGLPPVWRLDSVRELLVAGAQWKDVDSGAKEMWAARLKFPVRELSGDVWASVFGVALHAKAEHGVVRVKLGRGEFELLKDSKCEWYVLEGCLKKNTQREEVLRAARAERDRKERSLKQRVHVVERVEARGVNAAFEQWVISHKDVHGRSVWMLCMMRERTGQTQWFDALLDRNVNLAFDEGKLLTVYGSVDFWCEKARELTHQEVLVWERELQKKG